MHRQSLTINTRLLLLLLASLGLICAAAGSSFAQRTTPNQTGTLNGTDISTRERQIRSMEIDKEHQRTPQEILAEINEDMQQLKTLNDGIAHASAADQAPNYRLISDNVVEIKKRSLRLKTDLALPPADKDAKRPENKDADNGQLQPGLTTLSNLIDSFLHNPIFSDAGQPDPQLAAKARQDLDGIIAISDKLRKSADKLAKNAGKQ